MLKGISLQRRDCAWHIRNAKRSMKRKLSHIRRVALYKIEDSAYARSVKAKAKRDAYSFADKAKEKYGGLSWWAKFKLFISRLFGV